MRRRSVVTGFGLICGVGRTPAEFEVALRRGKRGFSRLSQPEIAHLKADHAALVGEFSLRGELGQLTLDLDRYIGLAIYAGQSALTHAGLTAPLGPRAGVVLGTCSGGMLTTENQVASRLRGTKTLNESNYFSARYYSAAKVLAAEAGARGPTATVVTACAAGTGAIAHGADLIRLGLCDTVLVGGADSFALSTLVGFDALKAVCEGMCAPFSENIGLNLGEGSAVLVIESMESALARGAQVYAEIRGSGLSNDAYHATSPDPSGKGQLAAMMRAVEDAGISPAAIDYINAHGTGTRANDVVESKAVTRLLGDAASRVPISATKSMIGHCLGAAGALEATAVIVAAKAGIVPPTAGFSSAREGCILDYVPDTERPFAGSIVLSNSFGFGGNNACIVLDTEPNQQESVISSATFEMPRVVLTGWGGIHPLGLERPETTPYTPECIKDNTRIINAAPGSVALIPDFDFRTVDRRLDVRSMDRCSKYMTAAARLALAHADIPAKPNVTAEIGLVSGSSFGPSEAESIHVQGVLENNYHLDRVDAFPYVVQNEAAGNTARALLLKGHSTVFSTGWGAGLAALMGAAMGIAGGHTRCVLAAAADEVSQRVYDDTREANIYGKSGIVLGEGAAAAILECADAANKRNANIFAEIIGFGAATETASTYEACITDDSARAALSAAMAYAGVEGPEIKWVAFSGENGPASSLEAAAAFALCPNAETVQPLPAIGFAEASLCLLQLFSAIRTAAVNDLIAALALSREGTAHAVILRRR